MTRILPHHWPHYCLVLLMIAQIGAVYSAREWRPSLAALEPAPSELAIGLASLGDNQAAFRWLALELQTAGDLFGKARKLSEYDYTLLPAWGERLDGLDTRSNLSPSIMAYYYGATKNPDGIAIIARYLEQHADHDPAGKWWWYAQAGYMVNNRLEQKDEALRLAYKLANAPGELPFWARQWPAFIHEQRGEKEQAAHIMEAIMAEYEQLPPGEQAFIAYFLRERLETLDAEEQPHP